MNFEYMVAFLSGDKGEALQLVVAELCKIEVVATRQYLTNQVEN